MEKIIAQLAKELEVKEVQVKNTIELLDIGNTVPFIARYRKEVTGNLSDEILRKLLDRLNYLRNLSERIEEVKKIIEEQGKLTEELKLAIENSKTLAEVEDLYRPYKQKKRTRGMIAKERGLEPLANIIYLQLEKRDIYEIATEYINEEKGVKTAEDAVSGALDIIAENISDNATYRKQIKRICYRMGILAVVAIDEEQKSTYEMYYDFKENVNRIPSHRILAINRGEKEDFLKVKIEKPEEDIFDIIRKDIIKNPNNQLRRINRNCDSR